ncbi:Uncharacterized protein HZ326_4906 [Fusarium oxysporum f. sp. albedinis]|nr:Uncharacterized protein HZ326_4906 [Fusarium oxysporum f. sp. albedinis]
MFLSSYKMKNNVKFKDLAPECGICREDIAVLPCDHQLQNKNRETHQGVILPCGHKPPRKYKQWRNQLGDILVG